MFGDRRVARVGRDEVGDLLGFSNVGRVGIHRRLHGVEVDGLGDRQVSDLGVDRVEVDGSRDGDEVRFG